MPRKQEDRPRYCQCITAGQGSESERNGMDDTAHCTLHSLERIVCTVSRRLRTNCTPAQRCRQLLASAEHAPAPPSLVHVKTTYALHTLDSTQPALSPRTHSLGVVVPLRDHTPPIAVPHAVAAAGQKHPSAFRQGRHLEFEREGSELPLTNAARCSYIPDGGQVTDSALFGKGACRQSPQPSSSGVQR